MRGNETQSFICPGGVLALLTGRATWHAGRIDRAANLHFVTAVFDDDAAAEFIAGQPGVEPLEDDATGEVKPAAIARLGRFGVRAGEKGADAARRVAAATGLRQLRHRG